MMIEIGYCYVAQIAITGLIFIFQSTLFPSFAEVSISTIIVYAYLVLSLVLRSLLRSLRDIFVVSTTLSSPFSKYLFSLPQVRLRQIMNCSVLSSHDTTLKVN